MHRSYQLKNIVEIPSIAITGGSRLSGDVIRPKVLLIIETISAVLGVV